MTPSRIARRGAWLFPLWVALLGADRIDLLGGRGPVVLTPFLVLLLPTLFVESAARRVRQGRRWLDFPKSATAQGALLLLLMALAAVSTINSLDASITVQRTLLLVAQAGGASWLIWTVADDPLATRRLAQGGVWGIGLAWAANLAQGLAFAGRLPYEIGVNGLRLLDLQPFNYAGLIPRLSGLSLDPNRAAYLAILHLAVVYAGRTTARRRWLAAGTIGLVGALSRSGLLAALVALGLAAFTRARAVPTRRHARDHARIVLALALMTAAVSAVLLWSPSLRGWTARTFAPAAERFSATEGSARLHADLLRRGTAEATRDVPRLLLGTGYGTSYLLLRDVFGTRYGNFHSLYLSMSVEAGLFALIVVVLLLLLPLPRAGRWLALLGATAVFNLFYQAGTEPALWTALALAWQEGAV